MWLLRKVEQLMCRRALCSVVSLRLWLQHGWVALDGWQVPRME